MRSRSAAALAVSAFLAATASTAQAADPPALRTTYPCYASGESVLLSGSGFTPNGEVALSLSGQQLTTLDTDSDGAFSLRMQAPDALFGTSRLRFTASDSAHPEVSDYAVVRTTDTDVLVSPMTGGPALPRRIRAWGFFGSDAFYAHVKRRGAARARNIYLGTPRGPCGVLDVRRRLFRWMARPGSYILQFDTLRRYYPNLESSVTYRLDVLDP